MAQPANPILDLPFDARPDPGEYIRAAMDWHFSPETGSPYWLERVKSLDFDPRTDVKSFADLGLFPNIVNELRDVPAEDLIPRGYGPDPEIGGVYESGGTTGVPKRLVFLTDWIDAMIAWLGHKMAVFGFPRNANWLSVTPSGPHMIGMVATWLTAANGGLPFKIDFDPRWVKKLIADGKSDEADAYAEHLIDQAGFALRTQDVGAIIITPPLLDRLARRDDLVELVNQKVAAIAWAGAHMDADTRYLYRTEVFPEIRLFGAYGSTMILGPAAERPGLPADDPCTFDPFSPYITFSVINPDTGQPVEYGERGQVVMNHVSKSALLPSNLERDLATRIEPPAGQIGDSVADVTPVTQFDNETVIEGVY